MGKKTLWASLLSLLAIMLFFELTNTDLWLQEKLFNYSTRTWYYTDPTHIYEWIFYKLIKVPIFIIGIATLIGSILSYKKNIWRDYRKGLLIVTLSLILLPGSIAIVGKNATNVQCPDDLKNFRGIIPYVKHFEPYPPNPHSPDGKWFKGRCWPAGHASGGFALFSLVCFFRGKKNKRRAFIFAMTMGWIMGVFQVIRGNHFISHHLTTMCLALILVSFLNLIIKDQMHESPEVKNEAGANSAQ